MEKRPLPAQTNGYGRGSKADARERAVWTEDQIMVSPAELRVEVFQEASMAEEIVAQTHGHKTHNGSPFICFLDTVCDAELHGSIAAADGLRPAPQKELPFLCQM
jgi:hypothetical protein